MGNHWEKAISILEGNLNLGRSYLITTVINQMKKVIIYLWFRRCQSGNTAQVIGCNGIMEETQLLQDTYSTYIYRFSYRFFPHYIILGILECLVYKTQVCMYLGMQDYFFYSADIKNDYLKINNREIPCNRGMLTWSYQLKLGFVYLRLLLTIYTFLVWRIWEMQ